MEIRQIDIKGERYYIESYMNPIPTGTVLMFPGITAPEGFLFCDGSEVSRVTYSKLFAVIGETYGSGDGSTTFNLPDYRETVLVGAGQNEKLNIKTHDVYNIGEFKDDQFQGHRHQTGICSWGNGNDTFPEQQRRNRANRVLQASEAIIADLSNGTPRTGSTTHGKQVGINYIIKV